MNEELHLYVMYFEDTHYFMAATHPADAANVARKAYSLWELDDEGTHPTIAMIPDDRLITSAVEADKPEGAPESAQLANIAGHDVWIAKAQAWAEWAGHGVCFAWADGEPPHRDVLEPVFVEPTP
jgi:hypothetical protein